MIKLKIPVCKKDCPFYLDHGTQGCMVDYHLYGTNRHVTAPEGGECLHLGKDIPEKPYHLMADFENLRAKAGKLETKKVSRN